MDTYPHELVGAPADPPTAASDEEIAAEREQLAEAATEQGDRPVTEHDAGEQFRDADGRLVAAGSWRLARALEQLRAEADKANPKRDRASDGTIGDAAHAATVSDHNPNAAGVVRALDLDVDGLDLPAAFERARALAAAGHLPQLAGGGYLILNRRITAPTFDGWRTYDGPNPHTSHGHASVSRSAAAYDLATPWGVFGAKAPAPKPPTGPQWRGPDLTGSRTSLRGAIGANGPRVAALQRWLAATFPAYARGLAVDGWWGPKTSAVLREFARRAYVAGADGLNIGPRLAAALSRYGFRG